MATITRTICDLCQLEVRGSQVMEIEISSWNGSDHVNFDVCKRCWTRPISDLRVWDKEKESE